MEALERLGPPTVVGAGSAENGEGDELYCAKPLGRAELEQDQSFCRVASRYDPAQVAREATSSPAALAGRAATVAAAVARLAASLKGVDVRAEASLLRRTLAELGPTAVKLGQNLANRPDLVRADYMEELTALQDRVPAFPNDVAMRIIEEDLGRPPSELFAELTEEPVAAASIGQVYRGRLADGTVVAVKVQRPGVRPLVMRDLYLLRAAAENALNGWARRRLGCEATLLVDEFAEKLLEELDFEQEARNLRDFRENFAGDEMVEVPYSYPELSGKRVLTMTWVDGVRCTDPSAFADSAATRRFIRIGVEAGLKQLLEFGLFHGDPHPGNVLARRDGTLGYVDFGNVAEISRANQEALIDAVVHAMNSDYEKLAGDLTALGFLAPGIDVRPIAAGLREVWGDSLSKEGLAAFSFRRLTNEFNRLLYRYPIRVPERFSLVIRALLTQESICLELDKSFSFLEVAFPYVARRLLTDPDPALRLRLLQVVVVDGAWSWQRLRSLVDLALADGTGGAGSGAGFLARLNLPSLVKDAAKMLARDAALRAELRGAFAAQPVTAHLREALSFVALFARLILSGWRGALGRMVASLRRLVGNTGPAAPPLQLAAA